MTLFLIGYMACGKTTFGRALAKETGYNFYDLDFYIEQRFRCSITDFFSTYGEDEFRRAEAELLREIGEFHNVIISCGGGTPCHRKNLEYMLKQGTVVWLTADIATICNRVKQRPDKRPLLKGLSDDQLSKKISKDLIIRQPYYKQADIRFDASLLEDSRQIKQSIGLFMKLHGNLFSPTT